MSNWTKALLIFLSLFLTTFKIFSVPLSNEELLSRCYKDITGLYLAPFSAEFKKVRENNADPIEVCLDALESSFFKNNKLPKATDQVQKAILNKFSKFHNSWFSERSAFNVYFLEKRGTLDIFDINEASLFVTNSLFNDTPFSSILKGQASFQAIRSNGDPERGSYTNLPKSKYKIGSTVTKTDGPFADLKFAETGSLIGIRPAVPIMLQKYYSGAKEQAKPLAIKKSDGGGILGTNTYMIFNLQETNPAYISDGAVKMHRKFSRSIFSDFLCRELPVIRPSDASAFVRELSSVPFRKANACNQCHATMDRMAGSFRNLRARRSFNTAESPWVRVSSPFVHNSKEVSWSDEPQSGYHLTKPTGYLFYRSYNGDLVHKKMEDGLKSVGQALTETNDFYVCAAKRYYGLLTGIDVSLNDIKQIEEVQPLTPVEKFHRDLVIKLGHELKEDQSLKKLIFSIMKSPIYSESDYFNKIPKRRITNLRNELGLGNE